MQNSKAHKILETLVGTKQNKDLSGSNRMQTHNQFGYMLECSFTN